METREKREESLDRRSKGEGTEGNTEANFFFSLFLLYRSKRGSFHSTGRGACAKTSKDCRRRGADTGDQRQKSYKKGETGAL